MRYIIGLDLGTTCVKATIFDETGNILGFGSAEDRVINLSPGFVEQRAESWVELSATVIRGALSAAKIDSQKVAALSISSQGITVVPVDKAFRPLRNAISWLDIRAESESAIIGGAVTSEELYKITGKPLSPAFTLPKILWLLRNEPQIFEQTHKLLTPHDYICANFCGTAVTDHTMASGTMLYDITDRRWADGLMRLFNIDLGLLPEIRQAGTPAGKLTKRASELTGLPDSTLVITGGQDQKVAAYGANLQAGMATISFGTAAAMEFLIDYAPHQISQFAAFPFIEPGTWVLEACVNTAGATINRGRDLFFPDLSLDDMNALAQSCENSGGVFFYPFLQGAGTPHNADSRGVFTGLTLGTSRAELVRAIFEGVIMEIYTNLCSARKAGVRVDELCLFGGGSKSAFICQSLADITGCAINSFSTPEMGSFGAAKLAAKALGLENFTLDASRVWEPDQKRRSRHVEQYKLYMKNLRSVFELS